MNRIPLWPFALFLILIAVAVTLHAEGPAHDSAQAVVVEAELPVSVVECECSARHDHRDLYMNDYGDHALAILDTNRTHVVQDRHESSAAFIATILPIYTAGEPRHLLRKAVGAAGVCSASHPSPIIETYPCDCRDARRQYLGGLA
jgi:hypothetical protein